MPLLPLIEPAVYGLLAGTLLSQQLRDVSAVALLALLVWERFTRDVDESTQPLSRSWVVTVAGFLAANLLSAWVSADRDASFEQLRFYPLGLLIFLGTRRVVGAGRWRSLAVVVLAMVAVFSTDTIWQWFHGQSFLRDRAPMWGRFQGSLVYPSDVSLLPILLPIGAAIVLEGGRWRIAVAIAAVALVSAAASLSGTRSAWVGLLCIVAAAGWTQRRAALGVAMLAIIMAVSVLAARATTTTAVERLFSARAYRAEKRLVQWQAAIMLFREAPILGNGPHSFRRIVRARHGEKTVVGRVELDYAPYPHNIYLEALCGTGAVGCVALLALLARGLTGLYRRRDHPIARAALTSLGALAAIGFFDLSLVKDWVQLCLWLPLGIASASESLPRYDSSREAPISADRAGADGAEPAARTPPR